MKSMHSRCIGQKSGGHDDDAFMSCDLDWIQRVCMGALSDAFGKSSICLFFIGCAREGRKEGFLLFTFYMLHFTDEGS